MTIFYNFQVSAVGDLMNNSWDTNEQENRKGKYISEIFQFRVRFDGELQRTTC